MAAPPKNTMQYVPLGNSGLKVSRIILGCMSYGSKSWSDWVIEDQEEINKHIKFAWESGITSFDTAMSEVHDVVSLLRMSHKYVATKIHKQVMDIL